VVAAAPPPVAHAAQAPPPKIRAYRISAVRGTERVEFAGDPEAGCVDRGVCGVSGLQTFTLAKAEPGSPAAVSRVGRRAGGQAFLLSGGTTTAQVTTAGSDQTCSDTFFVRQAVVTFRHRGGRVQALLHGPVGEPPLGQDAAVFATHCAGPRTADLSTAGVLPSALLRVATLSHRKLIFALRSDTPFKAAGFAGRVTADVRITLRRDRALERNLRLTGGVLISPGGGSGSSVAP
jgi:hypothetical protein